ncbi:uncharacterized protein mymx isoform X3 [Scleropages formosus]|uniref:uncharacterized protein mymx isoform X3 n=1 Tax=Scleropages formosus TaxID=113540 RepID=UPI0010FAC512|nr:uncharacterized protein LOC108927094 isoform X3 [Scleropages formosus]
MSESVARKVQPFTIGTRLSVPAAVPADHLLAGRPLDNRKVPRNLNERVPCLYLGQSGLPLRGVPSDPRPSSSPSPSPCPCPCPAAQVESRQQRRRREEPCDEDALNRNAASPTATSRSIRKITISGSAQSPGEPGPPAGEPPRKLESAANKNNNSNNNNNVIAVDNNNKNDNENGKSSKAGARCALPRIVGVSCENKPQSYLKVLLRKDASVEQQAFLAEGSSRPLAAGDRTTSTSQTPGLRAPSPLRVLLERDSLPWTYGETPSSAKDTSAPSDGNFTRHSAAFSREVLQAEAWIKGKLEDLKDDCGVQRGPPQDSEEVSQTLQRDLKDFENNLIRLNQMGEQLACRSNPTSDLIRKQLGQLREQWHALRQMAAYPSRGVGGATKLQEFNEKAEQLEIWIKEKQEEERLLAKVLGESMDKVQLTRRILDLKQDEQQYRSLHEEINNLALKLEKQSKAEGRNISARRKQINKMWLKVQTLLRDYHESLQLALEVSSFYQQADSVLAAISDKRKSVGDRESGGDREVRDIARQTMMLDVTVSQLSNLHPALASRVTQKLGEVKHAWAALQQAVRNEGTAPLSPASDFTREDGDPSTPSPSKEPRGSVGMEVHRIMGKEVKEEQNRLKGCATARDAGSSGALASGQGEDGLSESAAPLVSGSCREHADGVTRRSHSAGESGEPKTADSRPAAPRGRTLTYAQLQQFTVSADKTLAWLKDNVAIATHICRTASLEGIEAARRCQAALEDEILSNRARIEVVKKEGRSLVRAHHPGSAKIEEFLDQLEALWEELKRRHQSNVVVLQESEKLNLKAANILKDLNGLETWLQSVERTIRQSSFAVDPQSMSTAEQESSLLEKEVASRGLELHALRREVEKLHRHRHVRVRQLPARMEEVEEKYRCVRSALTQQSAELQDTRMLTEFLERVELEESQALCGSHEDSLEQPLRSTLATGSSLTGLPGVSAAMPLMESIGDPVEELREAVEMLNDTAREHSLSQDQGIQELHTRYSSLSVRINQQLSRCAALNVDILEAETDMAVKCEPHRCGLEGLWQQQDDLQVEYEILRDEVEETERTAARLQALCPERVRGLRSEAQATLQVWEELGGAVAENCARLQQFAQLRDFFGSYLALISWTEDTRACIFSDSAAHHGSEGQDEAANELDVKIEKKFQEFDDLAAAGQKLIDEEHHLTEMIRERTEELQSMLGWILVRWRAQKQQRHNGRGKSESKGDVIYSEAIVCSSSPQRASQMAAEKTTCGSGINGQLEGSVQQQLGDGYEVMGSIRPSDANSSPPGGALHGFLAVEESKSPFIVLKEPGTPLRGGTVNLILSLGKTGESVEEAEVPEPIHRPAGSPSSACKNFWRRCQGLLESTFGSLKRKRKICRQSADEVSTYLHVKENKGTSPVYENISLPHLTSKAKGPTSSSSSSRSSSSASPLKASSSSLIGSLKSKSMKRKRKEDVRRHTIQRITGPELRESTPASAGERHVHSTNTWPLKERKRKDARETAVSSGAEGHEYESNPVARGIGDEHIGGLMFSQPMLETNRSSSTAEHSKNHCRYLSLGSVLSFNLPKDLSLIPSIPDVITIGPLESKGLDHLKNEVDLRDLNGHYSHTERPAAMSTFKQSLLPSKCGGEKSKLGPTGKVSVSADCHPDTIAVSHQNAPLKDSGSADRSQTTVRSSLSDLESRPLSGTGDLREEGGWEVDGTSASLDADRQRDSDSLFPNAAREEEDLKTGTSGVKCTAVAAHHMCPSIHAKVQELNGHRSNKDCAISPDVASGVTTQLKNPASISTLNYGAIKFCTEAAHRVSTDIILPRGTVGRAVSLELDCCNEDPTGLKLGAVMTAADAVHPDHQQFEEEEEELEDIWNQTKGYRQSICSDIMYQTHQTELAISPPGEPRQPSPQGQAVLYRKLVTASAPNLLVAEFTLPPSVQTLLGYSKGHSHETGKSSSRGDRKSWAAFPQREPLSGQIELVNETASDPVKLPDTEERQKYIYQYREDEEEGEEELKDTGCAKDQSMSLLSLHMGLERTSCRPIGPDSGREEQGHTSTIGGRCISKNGRSPEFQSMEGSLERKHILQLGGKRFVLLGTLPLLDHLPCRPLQADAVLLPGQEGHAQELRVGTAAEPHRGRVLPGARIQQESQLLQPAVRRSAPYRLSLTGHTSHVLHQRPVSSPLPLFST